MRIPRLITCVLLTAMLAIFALPAAAQFGSIQKGPLGVGGCPHSGPTLGLDTSVPQLYFCGPGGWQPDQISIASFNATTAITTVTTAQTMASLTLPAGMQNFVNRSLEICASGVYTSPGTTAPTLTFQVKIGASVVPIAVTTSAVSTTASTALPWGFCYAITTAATGATGTLESHGYLNANLSANTAAAAIATFLDTNTAVSSAVDLTASNVLAIQAAASLTITSIQLRQARITVLY